MQEFAQGVYGKVYTDNAGYVYKVFYTDKKENESGWIREIVSLKNLNHPNIISPKYIGFNYAPDAAPHPPNIYMKMKQYKQLLKLQDNLSDLDILQSMLDLFNGIAYMHSKLIMHRDIKEANLLYEPHPDQNRKIKRMIICDFSLARYTINTKDIKHFNYLTPETITLTHRPPEVFQSIVIKKGVKKGKIEYNELVDVWSIGIVIFYMLTGIQLYHAIFNFGKNDLEFINFISKVPELNSISKKMKSGISLNGKECEEVFTFLMLSEQSIICIQRWLNKFVNKKLKYLDFFQTIMFECLADVEQRLSASTLACKLSRFILANDLTGQINDDGFTENVQKSTAISKISYDEKYIYSIMNDALIRIESSDVRGLILNKIGTVCNKFCKIMETPIESLDIKFIIALGHIIEILFLYEDIFTVYFRSNKNEIYRYINFVLERTNFLSDLL